MTTGTTTGTRSTGHRHDRHCYWDHLQCGWVCRPRPAADAEPVDAAPDPADPPLSAPSAAPVSGSDIGAADPE
jgi:hypothetical protein